MRIKRKNRLFVALLISSSLVLNGCWDSLDINNKSIILGVGIDQLNEKINFTGEVAKLMAGQKVGGVSSTFSSVYNFYSDGESFEEARSEYDRLTPLGDFMGAIRVIVFSKAFAEKDIEPYINRITNLSRFRKSMMVVVSDTSARELFQKKIETDISISYGIEDLISYLSKDGKALHKTVQEIRSDISFKTIGYVVPYVGYENPSVKLLGYSIIKGSKSIGIVEYDDSNGLLYLLSEKVSLDYTIESPRNNENTISINSRLNERKINTKYVDGKININVDLDISSKMLYEYNIELLDKEDIKKIEDTMTKNIKDDINTIIKLSQEDYSTDFLGFGRYFKGQNPREYKNMSWEDEYPNAKVNVNIKNSVTIASFLDPMEEEK
ncbi:Ger(x)C family spore germination protein [Clostridium algidicarnis]|uniref:Ger(x)C family spore germination protein n=1 Tax=Clostridium algidicarnis TaxID=37659 RepID=UPI001C0D730C|nr:Ger(x)C family spore germination protein [Clostridium algidicarnis]MBU3195873.1 Ger(x)C family spore germination protein [Clostridium algidicarnis]MBU3208899.1 Ger(x)C family spore germination protein [Clostridium algidicarnis]